MTNKFRILIVDDSEVNITTLTKILSPEYTIYTAKDGRQAISVAEKKLPDIIILDIVMPDMCGFEVLSKLKSSSETHNIPVIIITGLNNVCDEEKSLTLGAVDYITKPFHEAIIKARVKTHLKMLEYIRTIEQLCMIDTLTGLSNRRAFDKYIESEWRRAIREKQPISILIIDIDDFKKYNDTFGHQQGDNLLQALALFFKKSLKRSSDFAARWGGEEFAVLLPNTGIDGAVNVAERIRKNIENAAFPAPGDSKAILSVSIGVNSRVPDNSSSMEDFIFIADKALYNAKRSGKNRTSLMQ